MKVYVFAVLLACSHIVKWQNFVDADVGVVVPEDKNQIVGQQVGESAEAGKLRGRALCGEGNVACYSEDPNVKRNLKANDRAGVAIPEFVVDQHRSLNAQPNQNVGEVYSNSMELRNLEAGGEMKPAVGVVEPQGVLSTTVKINGRVLKVDLPAVHSLISKEVRNRGGSKGGAERVYAPGRNLRPSITSEFEGLKNIGRKIANRHRRLSTTTLANSDSSAGNRNLLSDEFEGSADEDFDNRFLYGEGELEEYSEDADFEDVDDFGSSEVSPRRQLFFGNLFSSLGGLLEKGISLGKGIADTITSGDPSKIPDLLQDGMDLGMGIADAVTGGKASDGVAGKVTGLLGQGIRMGEEIAEKVENGAGFDDVGDIISEGIEIGNGIAGMITGSDEDLLDDEISDIINQGVGLGASIIDGFKDGDPDIAGIIQQGIDVGVSIADAATGGDSSDAEEIGDMVGGIVDVGKGIYDDLSDGSSSSGSRRGRTSSTRRPTRVSPTRRPTRVSPTRRPKKSTRGSSKSTSGRNRRGRKKSNSRSRNRRRRV